MSPAIARLGRNGFWFKFGVCFVGNGLTKGVMEGDVFQVRDLESYPLYNRCRVRDRWKGLAICFRVAR